MGITVTHQLSATTPDDPGYEIQPQHWNQSHAFTLNAVGSEISAAFGNGNGVSFGLSADGKVTGSHNALTSQSSQIASADNGSYAFQTLSFSNANGFSFGTSAGSAITGSYTVPTVTNSSWTVSDAATSGTVGRLAFTNLNGVTLSLSSGAAGLHTIVGSHNALTSQSNQAFSAAGGSSAFQTLGFSDNAYASWTNTNGSVAINELRGSFFGTGNTTQSSSGTLNLDTVILRGSGAASVGVSNGSIIIDVAAGAAAITQSFGISTQTAGGATAGTSGYATGDDILYHFVPGSNITMSQSLNGASATLSIYAGQVTNTQRFGWPPGNFTAVAALGNGSFSINRVQLEGPVSATRLDVPFLVSLASSAANNTWGFAATVFGAVYTKNVSTLSSVSSGSTSFSFSLASNSAGQTQVIAHAIRPFSIPMNVNMSVGEYYVGFGVSTNTSSAGTATTALGNTFSVMGGPIYSSAVGQVSEFTATTNTSTGLWGGQGVYSAAVSTVVPAISLSAINQTGSYYARGNFAMIFRNI